MKSKKQKELKEREEALLKEEAYAKNARIDARASKQEEASKLGSSGEMLSTLQAIYVEQVEQGAIIEESDEHLEDLIDIQDGSGSEQRRDKLEASNKEKKDAGMLGKFASGVKGAFGKVGDAFGSVKDSLSGKLGLVVLGGALLLMDKYKDELFGPEGGLTKLLKWMHDDMAPAIKKLYDWVVVGWDKAWSGVVSFFEWAHGIFTKISDYFKKFDVDGDGSLDPDEMKKLQDDLVLKVGEFVSSVMSSVVGSIGAWALAFFAIGGLGYQFMKGIAYGAGRSIIGVGKDVVKKPSVWSRIFGATGGNVAANSSRALNLNKLPKGTELNKAGSLVDSKTKKIITTAEKLKLIPQKYAFLKSAARKIPFLGPIITSALGIQLLTSDASHEEKVIGIGKLIGEGAGAFGFGALGASLGAALGPPGMLVGAIVGSLGGFYGGGWVGEKVARFLMGKEGDDIISTESLHKENISALNVRKEELLAEQKGLSPASPQFKDNQETLGLIDQQMAFEQTGLDEAAQSDANLQFSAKTNRLAVVNKTIANEKYLLPTVAPTHPNALSKYNNRKDRIAKLESERDALLSELESLQFIPTSMIPKIASDTPGKMQQYMDEYKKSVTSAGMTWTNKTRDDAYNYAVNQISADQNMTQHINYSDNSMNVHQRDVPTNILNSYLQSVAGYAY
jgi:hypothetical protein